MFINGLRLNVDYVKKEIMARLETIRGREIKRFEIFRKNLLEGTQYFKSMVPKLVHETEVCREQVRRQLSELERELVDIIIPDISVPVET